MLFQKEKLIVRELECSDKYILSKWLSDPEILQYYEGRDNPFDVEKVEQKFFEAEADATRCIIEFDEDQSVMSSFMKSMRMKDRTYGYGDSSEIIYGMDQFIGESTYWNKGVGTQLVVRWWRI